MIDIYGFYEHMTRSNIMLSFKGDLTAELLDSLLRIMEEKMEKMHEEPKIRKKVFNVLVECLQNLYHHTDEIDFSHPSRTVLLMIGKQQESYYISTGNYILNDKVTLLRTRLDEINGLTRDELKTYYQNALCNNELSEKGGGGLGMIDIARKSGNKLQYEFKTLNDKHSFFSLEIKVGQ
jgi:hypothetical protein